MAHDSWKATACILCECNCGLEVELGGQDDRHLVRLRGDKRHPASRGYACEKAHRLDHYQHGRDRLTSPLRRRPDGTFEEISWDEVLDTIASELTRVKDEYGNEAIWYHYGSGSTGGNITQRGSWPRLLNAFGGYLGQYGDYSTAQITAAFPYQYGEWIGSNSLEDAKNSRLQVMFGNNPLETRMSGGGELGVVQKIKSEFGVRTIVVDPRYCETSVNVGDQWIALRPATDAPPAG